MNYELVFIRVCKLPFTFEDGGVAAASGHIRYKSDV